MLFTVVGVLIIFYVVFKFNSGDYLLLEMLLQSRLWTHLPFVLLRMKPGRQTHRGNIP